MNRTFFVMQNPIGGIFDTMARGLSGAAFLPSAEAVGTAKAQAAPPRPTLWERLDRWAWNAVQKEREAYLAKAANLVDLEERMRRLDSYRGRFY